MVEDAIARLRKERQQWQRSRLRGYEAQPQRNKNGTPNYMVWDCGVPGEKGTPWEGGVYWMEVTFSKDYPQKPPVCKFVPTVLHPNVYPSGVVCHSILAEDWRPGITLKSLLACIQELLYMPNLQKPVMKRAYNLLVRRPQVYNKIVRAQAREMSPTWQSSSSD